MAERKVSISPGNVKMGKVFSVSLPPIKSCGAGLPCYKGCYAAKMARFRSVVADAWENNWKMVTTDRVEFFRQITTFLLKKKPEMFRWHVSGDVPDFSYLTTINIVAKMADTTKFLLFTKKYDLLRLFKREGIKRSENLSIVVSAWPGMYIPPDIRKAYPIAWMHDPKNPDKRIPEDAYVCEGDCFVCRRCWHLGAGESVVFHKH